MKLFYMFIFIGMFLGKTASAETTQVPGVGSVWESVVRYDAKDDGSPAREKRETVTVDRMENGRPVFAGKLLNHDGEIVESSVGTVIYALECKGDVAEENLLPPIVPNQCGGHVCHAPPIGETFTRPMVVYAPLFGCQPQTAVYSFTSVRSDVYNGQAVIVGKALITLGGLRRGAWESYIQPGVGEVYSESHERKTTYEKVVVPLVPFKSK